VVGRWTKIPVSRLLEGEVQKLLHLDVELHSGSSARTKRCRRVAEAVVRARSA